MYSQRQHEEFKAACEPVMKWLAENCNPHTSVIIECDRAKLEQRQLQVVTDKFIKD